MKKGLIPMSGSNNYKNLDDRIFLTSAKDIAPWLAILKHKDNPVILEINTNGISSIETGRMFNDRFCISNGYGEYSSMERIPPAAIQETKLTKGNELGVQIRTNMIDQLENAKSADEIAEVTTGLNRLVSMGIIEKNYANAIIETHNKLIDEERNEHKAPDNNDEELPWAEEIEDDFTKAIGKMSATQMTLSDMGINV